MRIAISALALVVLLAPWPAAAAEPAIVYQSQPLGRMLNDLRGLMQSVGGDEAVKSFNESIKSSLGAKGFDGFDLNRPIFGYIQVPAKFEETILVIGLPMTNEKDWLDFVARWRKAKLKPAKDGLYQLPSREDVSIAGKPIHTEKEAMRLVDGYAYMAISAKDPSAVLDPKAILGFNKLYDGADASLMSAHVYFDRLPRELRAKAKEAIAQFRKGGPKMGAAETVLATPFFALAERMLDLSEGAKEAVIQLNGDAGSGEASLEATVTAISGSALEKLLAGMKPNTNRFAALVGADAAAGVKLRLPLGIPEVQKAVVGGLETLQKEAANIPFAPVKPTIDELLKGLIRTAKTGDVDAGAVLRGPSKDGAFTAVGGIAFDDPSSLEKEFKKFMTATTPPQFQDHIKWDAEKANGVSIHTVAVGQAPGSQSEFKNLFGENVMIAFAFAPKAIYVAIGPGEEAVKAVKEGLAAKPVAAPVIDLAYNPDKIVKLINRVAPPMAAPMIAKLLGTDNKLTSTFRIDLTGGKELKAKMTLNVKAFAGFMVPVRGARSVPVEPPPAALRK